MAIGAVKARIIITFGPLPISDMWMRAPSRELLAFGNFEPVVSVERESTAILVPEKVFEDMRSCGAGIMHVGGEGNTSIKQGAGTPS